MDGTLTAPRLDFDQIKLDMGIGSNPILETLKQMPEAERRVAEQILFDHEDRAAMESTLNPGCVALLDWLESKSVATALVTRNTRRSVATVFKRHGLKIDVRITREDGKYKPDPAPLLLACDRLSANPADSWMVGDGCHDIDAGVAANIKTVWISHGQPKSFPAEPWQTKRDLLQLTDWLRELSEA